MNSSSCSLYVIVRPSVVCRLSVTLVRPTQAVEIFGDVSTPFGTLAICWHPGKILRRSSQGNPSVGELIRRGVAEYSDFGPIDGYISETVQDMSGFLGATSFRTLLLSDFFSGRRSEVLPPSHLEVRRWTFSALLFSELSTVVAVVVWADKTYFELLFTEFDLGLFLNY